MWYQKCDKETLDFFETMTKEAKKDMPDFEKQDRPEKVKEIYKALKRDHPNMPAEMKARIAARHGKPGSQKQGPPYEAPIKSEYSKEDQEKDKKREEKTTKSEREEMAKEAGVAELWQGVKRLAGRMFGPGKKTMQRAAVGAAKVLRSNADIIPHFRSLPMAERQAILAKARAVATGIMESAERKAKAKSLLKILEKAI